MRTWLPLSRLAAIQSLPSRAVTSVITAMGQAPTNPRQREGCGDVSRPEPSARAEQRRGRLPAGALSACVVGLSLGLWATAAKAEPQSAPAAAGVAAVPATAQSGAPTATAPAVAAPAAAAPTVSPPAAALPAAPPVRSLGVVLWAAAPGESIPVALAQALAKQQLTAAPSGALHTAAVTVAAARRAVLELKCSEALPALDSAADATLAEVSLPEARPILSEAYGLMLVCADRLNDRARAEKASAALVAMQAQVPSDVALILARYTPANLVPFGPPRAPVRIETDPAGAVVVRNLIPAGVTPITIAGGNPAYDVLDVELPGMRKVRRPLSSGTELVLSLRPEDRPGVLLDRAAQLPAGSDEQAAVLRQLADAPLSSSALASRRLIVLGPKERAGTPIAEEPLVARIYDLDKKQWSSGKSDVAIGPPPAQAGRILALLTVAAPPPPAVVAAKAGARPAGSTPEPAKPPEKAASGFKLALGKTKWYTWVIAGGVVALLAGILIADKVSSDKLTVTATH